MQDFTILTALFTEIGTIFAIALGLYNWYNQREKSSYKAELLPKLKLDLDYKVIRHENKRFLILDYVIENISNIDLTTIEINISLRTGIDEERGVIGFEVPKNGGTQIVNSVIYNADWSHKEDNDLFKFLQKKTKTDCITLGIFSHVILTDGYQFVDRGGFLDSTYRIGLILNQEILHNEKVKKSILTPIKTGSGIFYLRSDVSYMPIRNLEKGDPEYAGKLKFTRFNVATWAVSDKFTTMKGITLKEHLEEKSIHTGSRVDIYNSSAELYGYIDK